MNRKKAITTLMFTLLILTAIGIYFLVRDTKNDGKWSAFWNREITVTDRTADPGQSTTAFQINESGKYNLSLSWNLQGEGHNLSKASEDGALGFITGCVITDPAGEMLYSTGATAVFLDTELFMNAGTYNMTFTYLTKEEDYISYAKKYLCGELAAKSWAKEFDFQTLPANGTWSMDYDMKVSDVTGFSARILFAILIVLVCVSLSVILLLAMMKGKQLENRQYDERQEMERGRGFRYGFFTTLIFCGGVLIFDWTGLIPGQNQTIFYSLGLLLGIAVHVGYCIWHESYFALNERPGVAIGIIGACGGINLFVAISSILRGDMLQNGRISEHFLNLVCAALMLFITGLLLFKKRYDKKHSDPVDDEE